MKVLSYVIELFHDARQTALLSAQDVSKLSERGGVGGGAEQE